MVFLQSRGNLLIFLLLTTCVIDKAQCIRIPDRISEPARDPPSQQPLKTAVFALGSFWRSESVFGCLNGVVRTTVGYAGGSKSNPEYRSLADHAESVQVSQPPNSQFLSFFLFFFPWNLCNIILHWFVKCHWFHTELELIAKLDFTGLSSVHVPLEQVWACSYNFYFPISSD